MLYSKIGNMRIRPGLRRKIICRCSVIPVFRSKFRKQSWESLSEGKKRIKMKVTLNVYRYMPDSPSFLSMW